MIIDPRAMLIAGGILIIIIALSWIAIASGRPKPVLNKIDFGKKN